MVWRDLPMRRWVVTSLASILYADERCPGDSCVRSTTAAMPTLETFALIGMHTRPEPWWVMKLTGPGDELGGDERGRPRSRGPRRRHDHELALGLKSATARDGGERHVACGSLPAAFRPYRAMTSASEFTIRAFAVARRSCAQGERISGDSEGAGRTVGRRPL